MDSITHIVLGAAVGEIVLGKKIGYKAALIGAVADTLPDFDIFLHLFTHDEILKLQIHRSYSHAMLPQLIAAFAFAQLSYLLFKKKISYWQWYLLWALGFTTHSLLDCCTTYGTQYLLPFSNKLIAFNNINVVDLFFTLPFLVIILVSQFFRKENPWRIKTAWIGLGYALAYIFIFSLVNKWEVNKKFTSELSRQNIEVNNLSTVPTFFNNFLWNAIGTSKDSLWFGEYSILQKEQEVNFVGYPRNIDLLSQHPDQKSIEVLKWFSNDKYLIRAKGDTLQFFNAKWGRGDFREKELDKALAFYFFLYPCNHSWKAGVREPDFTKEEFKSALHALWERMYRSYPFKK
jgi:inner membrane protein